MAVGLEMTEPRAGIGTKGEITRAQIEERPSIAGMTNTAAIRVKVIGRAPIVGVDSRIPGISVPGLDLLLPGFVVIRTGVITLDGVGEGRYQHAQACGLYAPRWADKQRDRVAVGALL